MFRIGFLRRRRVTTIHALKSPEEKHIHRLYSEWKSTHRRINYESCQLNPNLDYNYTFSIDSATEGIPFGVKSIGKT